MPTAFAGVSQPNIELGLPNKDIWVSKFKRLTADLESVAPQKFILAQNHKCSAIENPPKPDKFPFETCNATPDSFINMKMYAFGVLSNFGTTNVCEQVFSSMNYEQTTASNPV